MLESVAVNVIVIPPVVILPLVKWLGPNHIQADFEITNQFPLL